MLVTCVAMSKVIIELFKNAQDSIPCTNRADYPNDGNGVNSGSTKH